jgi:hypothetical protein
VEKGSKDMGKNNDMKKNTGKDQEQKYSQCLLRKRSGNVSILDVSWIPIEYAIVGKCLKFGNYDMNKAHGMKVIWDDGWVVIKVYGVRSEEDIVKMDWDYRKFNWIKVVLD